MRYADKKRAGYVIVLGDDEISKRKALVKDMQDGSQKEVNIDKIKNELNIKGRL